MGAYDTNRLTSYMEEKAKNVFDLQTVMAFIKDGFHIRTTSEEFKKLIDRKSHEKDIPQDEITKKLKTELGAQNFSNWWNGKVSISRLNAIRIAFVLEMGSAETNQFLSLSCWHDGFYMRDYKDLIYIFCLDNKLDYSVAQELIQKHAALDNPNAEAKDKASFPINERITDRLKNQYKSAVHTLESLDSFLERNANLFGSFRRKAYEKFVKMYEMIKNVGIDDPTDDEICQMVLMNIPSLKGTSSITNEILIKIAENTLPRSGLSEIINKTKDSKTGRIPQVNRKHLILMWLLIYGGRPDIDDPSEAQDAFEECITIINFDLLEPCGMYTLDPRNPFDWLVINALYFCHFSPVGVGTDDEDTDAVERIRALMGILFNGRSDAH